MKYFLIITAAYFLTRIANLTLIPIFTDEAIYLRWAQVMANNLGYFFLPLTDGKAPLFIWATASLMHFFGNLDPLVAGRLVSVICGYISIIAIYFATLALFKNKTTSLFASLLYLFSPFTFFYDRFALTDGMLMMFGILSLTFSVLLVRTEKIHYSLLLGFAIGLGLLTKTQGLFFFTIFPLCWFFLKLKPSKNFFLFLAISSAVGFLIYNTLRIFNEFYILSLKTSEFLVPLKDLVQNPFSAFIGNLPSLISWQITYLTLPIVVLICYSLLKKSRERFFLATLFLFYLFAMAFMNKVIYARYLLMFAPLLLILAAAGINDIKNKSIKILIFCLILIFPIKIILTLQTNPKDAQIAQNDSQQYLNSWSAGFGIKETVAFFNARSSEKAVLGVEGTFGLLPFALELYSHKYPSLEIKPFWPPPSSLPKGLDYYIIYQRETPKDFALEEIMRFQEGKSSDFFKLYRVK